MSCNFAIKKNAHYSLCKSHASSHKCCIINFQLLLLLSRLLGLFYQLKAHQLFIVDPTIGWQGFLSCTITHDNYD